jgi:hypothetical protein
MGWDCYDWMTVPEIAAAAGLGLKDAAFEIESRGLSSPARRLRRRTVPPERERPGPMDHGRFWPAFARPMVRPTRSPAGVLRRLGHGRVS